MNMHPFSKELSTAEDRSQIYAGQVRQLYDNALLGMAATLVNSLALAYVLRNVVERQTLSVWLGSVFLITALRFLHVRHYRRTPFSPSQVKRKGRQFIAGMALTGTVWGSAGIVLLPAGSLTHQVFIALVLGGMVAGAAGTYSVIRAAFLAFSVPALLPLILRLFSFGDELHFIMGGMMLLFGVLIHVMAFRVHVVAVTSLRLRYENKSLVWFLASEKERTEKLNEELRSEIVERKKAAEELSRHRSRLEELVKERTTKLEHANVRLLEEINARGVSEDLRRQSEVYFRSLIENALDLITVLDSRGTILFESPSLKKLLGYDPEDLIGDNVFGLVHPEDLPAVHEAFARVLAAAGAIEIVELRIRHQDGSWRLLEAMGKSVVDDAGVVRVIVNSRDNTERKRMAEDVMKAQKLDSLGILAGGIAHDFNNIITGITANIELARMHVKRNDLLAPILEKAEQASVQAHGLAQQLLTFARGGEPIKKTITINDLVMDTVNFALRGYMGGTTFSLAPDAWPVEADSGQLRQAIHNIVVNADQAMPQAGMISVACENVNIATDSRTLGAGDYVKISITDKGVGIPKEHLTKIFDPYFTTKQTGSGLGLATAYSIVKKHNGDITVASEPGVGTMISIYLPASADHPPVQETAIGGIVSGKGRILIMDDEEIVLDAAGRILETAGYTVALAKDGEEAIALYKNALQAGRPFDIVIIDLTVPGGVGGKDAIRELIEIDPKVRAIVSSGYAHDPIMAHYKKYGFRGVLAKPYRVREMSEIVSRVMAMEG